MIKRGIVTTASHIGRPPMEMLPLGGSGVDTGWLRKRGSVLEGVLDDLQPRDGMSAIYMIPISAMEVTGSNRNGDFWPETGRVIRTVSPGKDDPKTVTIREGLIERHPTFVSDAKMYRDHKNDDPEKASGEIVKCVYSKPMGRPEAIAFVDNDVWDNDLNRLSNNQNIGVSMSARVPFDVCNICGNKARRRAEYCDHILRHMNTILSDGTQIGVVNESPTFFDISGVRFNADRLGFGLAVLPLDAGQDKAAGVDLRGRQDMVKKLAAMEKTIQCEDARELGRSVDPRLMKDPSSITVRIIRSYDPRVAGRAMRKHRIMLRPRGFMKVVCDESESKLDEITGQMKRILPRVFRMLSEGPPQDLTSVLDPGRCSIIPAGLRAAMRRLEPDLSIDEPHIQSRMRSSIRSFSKPPEVLAGECGDDADVSPVACNMAKEYGKYLLSMIDGEDADSRAPTIVVAKTLSK